MDFSSIGSIGAFTRSLKMKTQWNLKKESGRLMEKKDSRAGQSGEDPQIASLKRQLDRMKENKDDDLERIHLKMQCGKNLSADELDYLRERDPASYREAVKLQAERESYKRELKKCKTKEDVERLRFNRIGNSLAQVNSVMNNPAIPKAKKLALVMQENAKVNAITDESVKFVESGKYAKLPTEAERNQEAHEKNEGEREEIKNQEKQEETGGAENEKKPEIEEDVEKTDAKEEASGKTEPETTAEERVPENFAEKLPGAEKKTAPDRTVEKNNYEQATNAYREIMTGPDESRPLKRHRKNRA